MYKNLKIIRQKKGYTQEEMSKILGYHSKNAYSLKERGERKFTLDESKRIADLFGKSIEDVFFCTFSNQNGENQVLNLEREEFKYGY